MSAYVIQRVLLMFLTLLGMSVIIFVLLRLVPGNIVDIMFDSAGFVDPSEKATIEKELGLDLPIYQQYFDWISALLVGDLGFSFVSEMPAIDEIGPRIPITAKLAALSLFFSILFGLPLGVISAVRQNTTLDYVLRVISLSGLSFPLFGWPYSFLWHVFPIWAQYLSIQKRQKPSGMSYCYIFCLRLQLASGLQP